MNNNELDNAIKTEIEESVLEVGLANITPENIIDSEVLTLLEKLENFDDEDKNFIEVVLTGGPCSGKSSSLAYLIEELTKLNYRVLCVPEVATMLVSGGLSDLGYLAKNDPEKFYNIEKEILFLQSSLRSHYINLAKSFSPVKVVIVYDRAEMDVKAYLPDGEFEKIVEENELTYHKLRDSYDAVIHLVTAAYGAEEFYSLENNQARTEDIQEARLLDDRIMQAWNGSNHLWIVNNECDFKTKLYSVFKAVLHTLGHPEPMEIEKKYLINKPDFNHPILQDAQKVEITQTYLNSKSDVESRVRQRSFANQSTHFFTRKRDVEIKGHLNRIENELIINQKEYNNLLSEADENKIPITKTRYLFPNGTHYFELDEIKLPNQVIYILEVELLDNNVQVKLPDFLGVIKEVTTDKRFKNSYFASNPDVDYYNLD